MAYGLGAYLFWGVAPLYWRFLTHVPAEELLAHRLVWACLFFVGILAVTGRTRELLAIVKDPKLRWRLLVSACFVAINWFVFVYAVIVDRVLDVSLGYFTSPLVSVALGRIVLGETLRRTQVVAVGLAAVGIVIVAVGAGGLPWISLALAFSFGAYGVLRKTIDVPPLAGSAYETVVLLPLGVAFLVWLGGDGHFATVDRATDGLIAATGLATGIPLLLFVNAARRLRLTTIGFLQYIAPSLHFIIAVVVFLEPAPPAKLVAFGLVWGALAIFSWDAWRLKRAAADWKV